MPYTCLMPLHALNALFGPFYALQSLILDKANCYGTALEGR